MPIFQEIRHEGSHQAGGLGSTRAYAGGHGNDRDRELHLLLAVKAVSRAYERAILISGGRERLQTNALRDAFIVRQPFQNTVRAVRQMERTAP